MLTKILKGTGEVIYSFFDLTCLAVGAAHGFGDAQGILIPNQKVELALTFGPAAVKAGVDTVLMGTVGTWFGIKKGYHAKKNESIGEKVAEIATEAFIGGVTGAGVGAASGALRGGLETTAGYAFGYAAGYFLRQ